MVTRTTVAPSSVGKELRRWRERRALTQLTLASRAEVSTRHLSFVENGRSRPTPGMILRLAEEMQVPMAEQNRLLLTGGYAPRYERRPPDSHELAPVMAGLRRLLDAHAPYPALLLDDHWDVVDANEAVDTLLVGCAPDLLEPPLNALRLSLDERGLAPRIRNLATWRAHLLHQLEQRIVHTGGDPKLESLRDEFAGPRDSHETLTSADPVLTLEISVNGRDLRLFSIASRIENPADVTLDGLHLETFVPADDATRRALETSH
jgi:transcriptional regulator with XRE-family HTH domain